MPQPRILLVELDGLLAQNLRDAWGPHAEVNAASAPEALDTLLSEGSDLAIMNLELTQGSGFGLVNRMRRMEALDGIQVIVVSEKETQAALDAHRDGPTPADGYVRGDEVSATAFTEMIQNEARRLLPALPEPLPEVGADEVEELVDDEPAEARAPDPADEALQRTMAQLGDYRVLRRLRDEDGGAVFACMDDELGRAVAIKVLPPSKGEDDERMQRFLRERRVLALINSPYVLGVYGAGSQSGCPYLVRELIVGEDLEELVKRDGPLSFELALQYGREIASGLSHAHSVGVVHRDVRPKNIYIVDEHAKLARFGSGRLLESEEHRITMVGARMPDQVYTAPERVLGKDDHRSDIYSLGVTLFTLLAGRPPFTKARPINQLTGKLVERPAPLESVREDAPAPIAHLVARLMAEDPAQRPQDYDAVLAAFDEAEGAATTDDPGPAPIPQREPTGVQGTLRRMNVPELVQTLEIANKTATVNIDLPDGLVGTLAFKGGRLVHAALGLERGEEAFYNLVPYKRGTFRVSYDAVGGEHNINTPVTALLLEAVRREDESGRAVDPPDELSAEKPLPASVIHDDSVPCASCGEPIEMDAKKCVYCGARTRPPRRVPTSVGFIIVALVSGLAVYGGLNLKLGGDGPPPEPSALAPLIEQQRKTIAALRTELDEARPKIEQMEADAAAKNALLGEQQTVTAAAERNLAAALAADIDARRIRLRLSDDQTELVLEINSIPLFGGQRDVLTEEGANLLSRTTGAVAALKEVQVRVEGHSDNQAPPASSGHKNNWGLAGAQANAVATHLTNQGLNKGRVSSVSMADSKPVISNRGPKGRARNRRVELHLLPKDPPPTPP